MLACLQDAEDQERPNSADVAALYHALEGSVVLLQVTRKRGTQQACLEPLINVRLGYDTFKVHIHGWTLFLVGFNMYVRLLIRYRSIVPNEW